ncbi:MAG: hypothetical protein ABI140_10945 [Jatrophihabitantaceae bacterium]
MRLSAYTESVKTQLTSAAALGDERTREIASALATTAESAVRMAVLDALTAATAEITAALHDANQAAGSPAISVQLDGEQLRFTVTAPPPEPEPAQPAAGRAEDGEASARISLRLPEALKLDIEQAAGRAEISVNSWLVRAASTALRPAAARGDWSAWTSSHSGQRITGWITG